VRSCLFNEFIENLTIVLLDGDQCYQLASLDGVDVAISYLVYKLVDVFLVQLSLLTNGVFLRRVGFEFGQLYLSLLCKLDLLRSDYELSRIGFDPADDLIATSVWSQLGVAVPELLLEGVHHSPFDLLEPMLDFCLS